MTNTITKITYDWDDYKVWAEYTAGTWISISSNQISNTWVTSFNWNTWTVTYTAPVTSVNGSTWAVTVSAVPAVWTNGQVLTVVSWAAAWANASGWDVKVSSQAHNLLTTGMKIWCGTEWDYANLGTYDSNSLYLTVPWGATPWWWQPWANTMLYLPMETDLLDHSGNSLTVNNLWSVSLVSTWTWASVPVAQFNSTSTELTFAYQWNINSAWTMSFWENIANQNTHAQFITAWTWSRHNLFQLWYTDSPSRWLTLSNYGDDVNLGSYAGRDGSWHLITATYSGVGWQTNNAKVYIDGSLAMQWTMQWWNWNTNTFMVGNYNQETNLWWFLSKFIVETAERTAQEVADYYDLTKWDYWIS